VNEGSVEGSEGVNEVAFLSLSSWFPSTHFVCFIFSLSYRALPYRPGYYLGIQGTGSYDRYVVLHGTEGQGTVPHTISFSAYF
jgi:hypothetical protein